jgi:pyrroline-5-carboxylate reductase
MATALARGLVQARFLEAGNLIASDVSEAARQTFTAQTGAVATPDNRQVVESAQVLVIAVKPQQLREVLGELRGPVTGRHLVVSVVAGAPLATLRAGLGEACRLVRVMPNTPCLVGSGASAFACDDRATEADAELVRRMLSTVGLAVPVPESQLDAVTGLSGSGPAYAFVFVEALADAGVLMGLPRQTALQLAAQTVVGAARMVLETGDHPSQLKDAVASPGGTTIAGLYALEQGGLRGAVMRAVEMATRRSQELGRS